MLHLKVVIIDQSVFYLERKVNFIYVLIKTKVKAQYSSMLLRNIPVHSDSSCWNWLSEVHLYLFRFKNIAEEGIFKIKSTTQNVIKHVYTLVIGCGCDQEVLRRPRIGILSLPICLFIT